MPTEARPGLSWSSVALAGVLAAVSEFARGRHARSLGLDPTIDHDPEVSRRQLRSAGATGMLLLHRWQMALHAGAMPGRGGAADVDLLGGLLAARRLESELKRIHQHLMGLYPSVEGQVVEGARRVAADLGSWIEDPVVDARLAGRVAAVLDEARRA